MIKKHFLISGAIAALALTATAVISAPQFASVQTIDDVAEEAEYAVLKATYPEAQADIPVTQPVKTIWFQYDADKLYGIKIDRTSTEEIVVLKDGVEFEKVPVSDTNAVWMNPDDNQKVFITLPTELTEVGTYTVQLPTFFEVGQTGTNEKYLPNSPEKLIFSISLNNAYVASPAAGDVLAGGLDTVTLTYPEGSVINVAGASVKMTKFSSGSVSDVTTYKATASGNVVTLTADDPSAIEVITKNASNPDLTYYSIEIEQGAWTVDGNAVPATSLGHYWVLAFEASSIKMTPGADQTMYVDGDLNITLEFPEPVTLVSTSKMYFATIKGYPGGDMDAAAQQVYYDLVSQSDDKKTLVLTPNSMASNLGKMKTWINSKVVFTLSQNKVKNAKGQSNSALTFPAFNFVGVQEIALATTGQFNPVADYKLTGTDIKNFSVKYLYNVLPSDNENLKATLSLNGNVIKEWTPSEATPRTEPAQFAAAGTATAYFLLDKEEWLNSFSAYGTYTMSIPAGFFVAAVDKTIPSVAASWNLLNPDPTGNPTPSAAAGGPQLYNEDCDYPNLPTVSEIQIVYPEGCTVQYNSAVSMQNVFFAKVRTKNNKLNPPMGLSSSVSGYFTCDKNVATLHFNDPVWVAVGDLTMYSVKFPAGIFKVTKDGSTYENEQFNVFWKNLTPSTPTVQKVDVDTEYKTATLSDIPSVVTTNDLTKYFAKPFLLIPEGFYKGTNTPYFEVAETGEKIDCGAITFGKETDVTGSYSSNLFYITVPNPNALPLGNINLVVPEAAIFYQQSTLADASNNNFGFANKKYVYPFTIEMGTVPAVSIPGLSTSTSYVTAKYSTDLANRTRKVTIIPNDEEVPEDKTPATYATITLSAPEYFATIYTKKVANAASVQDDAVETVSYVASAVEIPSGWMSIADAEAKGFKKTASISVPRDGQTYTYQLMNSAYQMVQDPVWTVEFTFDNTTAVDALDAEAAEAEYYTLQGVRVQNPGAGLYIRIADGKATKVIRK